MAGGFIAFRCSNFENTAEREQFRTLCKQLRRKYYKSEKMCFLIANYNIFDSEFDAILVKNDAIVAIEFKNYGGKIMAGFFTVLYPYNSDCPFKIGYREKYVEFFGDEYSKQDRISSANVSKVNPNNLSRFSSMPLDETDLAVIYNRISSSKASVISMQSDKGEVLLIAYGYDYLGNIYVADYYDNEKKGKLNVTTQARLIKTENGD